jgi:hypothetical protein
MSKSVEYAIVLFYLNVFFQKIELYNKIIKEAVLSNDPVWHNSSCNIMHKSCLNLVDPTTYIDLNLVQVINGIIPKIPAEKPAFWVLSLIN